MVEGSINERPFQAPLEPDGKGSHRLKVDKGDVGDTVKLSIAPVKVWPEPKIPDDLESALAKHPDSIWEEITTMARWDWIRWIGATGNAETR